MNYRLFPIKQKYFSVSATASRENQTTIPLMNQRGNIYEEYLNTEYPCSLSDNYTLSVSFRWSTNNARANSLFRLYLDDGTKITYSNVSIESKDTGGVGEVADVIEDGLIIGQSDTSADVVYSEFFLLDTILEKGKTYKIGLEFTHQESLSRTTIHSSTIRIEQKTQNP